MFRKLDPSRFKRSEAPGTPGPRPPLRRGIVPALDLRPPRVNGRLGPAALAMLAGVLSAVPVSAQEEPSTPLTLRVRPGGYEGARETLDQKLARRTRESEFMFRSICRGCLSGAAEADIFGLKSNGIEIPVPDPPAPAQPPS